MIKISRNEPCPCGSNKKYKKCCGTSNTTEMSPKLINIELDRLHQELNGVVLQNLIKSIHKQTNQYASKFNDETVAEVVRMGLVPWVITNKPLGKNNITIFDGFYNVMKTKVSVPARNELLQWKDRTPSVYEVLSVDPTQFIIVKDILTEDVFNVPFIKETEFVEGSLIAGNLLPLADNQYTFLFTFVKLYHQKKEVIMEYLQKYTAMDGGLKVHYPDFLVDVVQFSSTSNVTNPIYEQVIQTFVDRIIEKDVTEKSILEGIKAWNIFCEQENPSIKKMEGYAAALEYFTHKTILSNDSVTQEQIAKEYNVSAGTVSTNFRKLTATNKLAS